MIGAFLMLAAMGLAAVGVGGMVLGARERPPFGLSLPGLALICLTLALLGVVLLRMGV
ncbi:MAG: hypothetical protein AAF744_11040 [Pseudomonadota bacterium]